MKLRIYFKVHFLFPGGKSKEVTMKEAREIMSKIYNMMEEGWLICLHR